MNNQQRFDVFIKEQTGAVNVYFQPPADFKLTYPAILYKRDSVLNSNANNRVYRQQVRYQVTVVDPDPNSVLTEKISLIPNVSYVNNFQSDKLNHDVFNIIF